MKTGLVRFPVVAGEDQLVLDGVDRAADLEDVARDVLVEHAAVDVADAGDVEPGLGDVRDDVAGDVVAEGAQVVHSPRRGVGAFGLAACGHRERVDAHEPDAEAADVGADLADGVRQRPGHALVVDRLGWRDTEPAAELVEPGLVGGLAALPVEHEHRAGPHGPESAW